MDCIDVVVELHRRR